MLLVEIGVRALFERLAWGTSALSARSLNTGSERSAREVIVERQISLDIKETDISSPKAIAGTDRKRVDLFMAMASLLIVCNEAH